jgi:hypothetical protein
MRIAAEILSRLRSDEKGAVAIMSALALPVLIAAMGFAVDYSFNARDRAELRAASDTTALALARELAVINPNAAKVQAIGAQMAHDELKRRKLDEGATVTATVQAQNGSVQVDITRPSRSFFKKFTGQQDAMLGVKSVATLAGRRKICVVTLDPSASNAMQMKDAAWLTTENCDVYSDSTSASGISIAAGNKLTSSLTCSAGGIQSSGTITGERLTDCPTVPDPLATRPAPPVGACTATDLTVKEKGGSPASRYVIYPGTYCGGLRIKNKTFVTFAPGVYVIKDGELRIDNDADVAGNHVGFYLSGESAGLKIKDKAKIWFNAPKDGPMAGLLFFEDRAVSLNREHDITSDNVANLTGTIYMPRGRLLVDAAADVAADSAFTLIVANQMRLENNPRLVVNSDYGLTDVPVPMGLGLVNAAVRLAH